MGTPVGPFAHLREAIRGWAGRASRRLHATPSAIWRPVPARVPLAVTFVWLTRDCYLPPTLTRQRGLPSSIVDHNEMGDRARGLHPGADNPEGGKIAS